MTPSEPIISPTTPIHQHAAGPRASYIQVAQPYVFEHQILQSLSSARSNPVKEDTVRLQGVAWIDSLRKSLQLPVRTFNTAVVYYHKFRLVHSSEEYNHLDAAAAALFTACKIEDTLKKSKEILCAAYNLKLPPSERVSPDDPIFEQPSRTVSGLERLMLEASGFDFRCRHPQRLLVKLAKHFNLNRKTVAKTAYNISIDVYRTFIPLKQSCSTMAFACLELAARIHNIEPERIFREHAIDYQRWFTSREEVIETLFDLLDLYTHHRTATKVGQQYPLDVILTIRIALNNESSAKDYPRYTCASKKRKEMSNGDTSYHANNGDAGNGGGSNGNGNGNGYRGSATPPKFAKTGFDGKLLSSSPTAAAAASSPSSGAGAPPPLAPSSAPQHHQPPSRVRTSDRGRDGTVRFMLDAERALMEQVIVADYSKLEEVETEAPASVQRNGRELRAA